MPTFLTCSQWLICEGLPERWDQTSACKGALLQSLQSMFWSHLAHPDRWWHIQIDHDSGAYVPCSFPPMSQVLLCPLATEIQGWRRQEQRLGVTAQWHDHLNWGRGFTASMISLVFFKDLGWRSGRGLNSWPPAQQTGALPTELTGRQLIVGLELYASRFQIMELKTTSFLS